jgi:hypothetical protein
MRIAQREPEEEAVPVAEQPPGSVGPMPAAVLRMQAAAGNRATADLLARAGQGRDQGEAEGQGRLDDDGRTVRRLPAARATLPNHDKGDIDVADGARLQRALSDLLRTVTIKGPTMTITMTDVVISGYVSGGTHGDDAVVTVQLNAQKREFK